MSIEKLPDTIKLPKTTNGGADAYGKLSAEEFNALAEYVDDLPADVRINGTSIVNQQTKVANIPLANNSTNGAMSSGMYHNLSEIYEDWNNHDWVDSSDLADVATSGDYNDLSNTPTLGTAASKDTGASTGSIPTVGRDGALTANKPVMTDSYLGLKTVETLAQTYITGLVDALADKLSRTNDKTDTVGFSTTSKIPSVLAVLNYTYNKSTIDEKIAAMGNVGIVVVASLPAASAETMGKIYLIPSTDVKEQNIKDEYITWLDGSTYKWEKIGSTQIDLSNYYTIEQVDELITDLAESIQDHAASTSNPHNVTKSQVGLGNVDNKSAATIISEIPYATTDVAGKVKIGTSDGLAMDEDHIIIADGGVTKVKLDSSVQASLNKADTALQQADVSGKENTSNKVTTWSTTPNDTHYPSEKLVKDSLDGISSTLSTFDTKTSVNQKIQNVVSGLGSAAYADVATSTSTGQNDNLATIAQANSLAVAAASRKQDTISDLATIRTNAQAGKTANDKLNNGEFTATADFEEHVEDTTVHITASERVAWNSKVNKSGDTITGKITRNAGGRWIDGRDTATVSNDKSGTSPTAETFNPVCSVKTHAGAWAIGSLCRSGSNPLHFVYTKDSDYSTGGNTYYPIELPAEKRGVIALTSDIPSVSVNASQGTISVNGTTVGTSNNPVGNARSASTSTSATKAESITYKDARSTNPAPYSSDFFKGIEYALKSSSADGLQDIGIYHGVMTLHQWGDVSGGDAWQLAFAQSGNISFRHGKTSWSDWGELVSSGNVAKFTASGMRLVPKKIYNSTTGTVDDVLYLYSPIQLTIGTGASEAHVNGLDVRFARRGKWICRNKIYGNRVRKRGWRIVDTKELCADGQRHYVIGDHNGNGQGSGMSKINVDVRLVDESPASHASGWLYKVYIGGKYKLAEIIRLFERAADAAQIEFYDGNLKVLYCRDMATEPGINRYHSVVTLDFGIALNGVILPFGIVLSNRAQKWDPSLRTNVVIPADDVSEYYRFAKFTT